MKKSLLLPIVVMFMLFIVVSGYAQSYRPHLNIPVTQFGNPIIPSANAWTGGFDSPVFSQIDMDGDSDKDLFIFEKEGASQFYFRYTTYINNGTPNQVDYTYAPQYKECFPKNLHDWVKLVDYDCDGYEDIFTYNYTGGITVYHNDYPTMGFLKFHKEYELVSTIYFGIPVPNLFVAANSQPALVDVDDDEDLDVLTFSMSSNTVEYHQNLAQENFGRCDTLVYNMVTGCWGNFGLQNDTACNAVMGISCRQAALPPSDELKSEHLHTGFCSIAADMDGDADKEFINGDINCMHVAYFENGGTLLSANIVSIDSMYPSQHPTGTQPAYLGRPQLGPHYFDVDNDGNKDLIVAPCGVYSKNFNNVLFYKNNTSNTINDFTYVKNSLFVDNMIELGSGANVSVTDIDGDGLQDMIIGNYTYIDQIPTGTHPAVAYYRNNGTATNPSFNLMTTDFANTSSMGVNGLAPTFGDLDGDGDKDMIVGGGDGYLNYFQNMSGNYILTQPHMNASNGNPINCGTFATPFIVDLNRDGRLDLVIGEKLGNLNYYENTGSLTNYAFTFVTNTLGGVNVTKAGQDIYGYSAPFIYDSIGTGGIHYYQLVVGSLSGFVYKYDNIDNNLSGNFHLVDSMFLYEAIRSTVAGADINNDGKEDFLIGNFSGGVTWYSNGTTVSINEIAVQNSFNVYPNPAKDVLYIKFEKSDKHDITITDMLGKLVFFSDRNSFTETIDVSKWNNGMYVVKVVEAGIVTIKKFIIRH